MKHVGLLLALTAGLMGLSGCGGWLSRQSTPTTQSPTITVQDIRPTGAPLVTIQTTPGGWQITARQPIERTEVAERPETQQVQRRLFFPPAIFPGLIQCPIGGMVWLFSLGTMGQSLASHGCMRLLMIETLPGVATTTTDIVKTTQTVSDSEPLRGALVSLDHTPHSHDWNGLLDLEGLVLIPYQAADTPSASSAPRVTIYRQQASIWSGALPQIPKEVASKPPQQEWSKTLVFQIEEATTTDPALLQPLQQLLQQELLKHGQSVVVGEGIRTTLRNELQIQQAGLTTDPISTSSLHWMPATILIRTTPDRNASTHQVQVSWIAIETGRVLSTEMLSTSLSAGQQAAQIRIMLHDKLPSLKQVSQTHE